MSQRFEGQSLEGALNSAATALGVDRHRLAHRVVLEKRGFLGGIKRVVIEVDVIGEAEVPAPPPQPLTPSSPAVEAMVSARAEAARAVASESARPSQARSRDRDAAPARRSGRREGGRSGRSREGNAGGRDRARRGGNSDQLRPGDFERIAADLPEQTPQSEAAAAVRDWCERTIALAGLTLTLRTDENDERIAVRLFGPDTARLVDRHGELLDALQVLANKALVGRKAEKDIELDCDAFKEKRETELIERAHSVADRVRRDGREQLLPAMSPIERRIVHLALRDDDEVTTESRGEGFYKRVAVVRRATITPEPSTGEP
jgi:spoIIIJ-associated protein